MSLNQRFTNILPSAPREASSRPQLIQRRQQAVLRCSDLRADLLAARRGVPHNQRRGEAATHPAHHRRANGGPVFKLLELRDELLLKVIHSMTTTEGRGLLLACRRLSGLIRQNMTVRRLSEARIRFAVY